MTVESPTRRRRWVWPAAAAALILVAAGVAVIVLVLRGPAVDTEGKQACQIANNWQQSRPDLVNQTIVDTIHDHSVHSTHADLVYRGDQMYDAWHTASTKQLAGDITPGERDLQAMGPLTNFRTACQQAGY
jgi:hypothetical protein